MDVVALTAATQLSAGKGAGYKHLLATEGRFLVRLLLGCWNSRLIGRKTVRIHKKESTYCKFDWEACTAQTPLVPEVEQV